MPQKFCYTVRTEEGIVKKGIIEANEMAGAATLLRKNNYWIIDLKPVKYEKDGFSMFKKKSSANDLAKFTRNFASLVNSGINVLKALMLSKQTENRRFSIVIDQVTSNVEAGLSLSEALAKHPQFFPNIYVGMVAAGESGGVLGQILTRLAAHFENVCSLTEKVKAALSYPILVIGTALLCLVLMMTMVLPVFESMLRNVNATLPFVTLIVVKLNKLFMSYKYHAAGLLVAFCCITAAWIKTVKGREALDYFVVRMPVFGKILHKVILARFCRTLSTLLYSGIPVLTALTIVKETLGNAIITKAVTQTCQGIEKGENIAVLLQKCSFFPPLLIHMVTVGEETGSLGELLEKAAVILDREIENSVSNISSLLEPFLVLIIGGIVGIIVISVLLPVYQTLGAYD